MKKTHEEVSIVVIGDAAVGKSCVIQSFLNNTFIPIYYPTSCNKYECLYHLTNGPYVKLIIWDTSGLPEFDGARPLCYTNTDLFIICFTQINPSTIKSVKEKWLPEVDKYGKGKHVLLLGTKRDLSTDKNPGIPLEFLPVIQGNPACSYAECSAQLEYAGYLKQYIEEAINKVLKQKADERKGVMKRVLSCRCNLL